MKFPLKSCAVIALYCVFLRLLEDARSAEPQIILDSRLIRESTTLPEEALVASGCVGA